MVYGGAVAAGAFADQDVTLFGRTIDEGLPAYVAIALAGTIGYTIGAIGGWAIGLYGGRPYLERHGRWLHLDEEKLDRAERWFERWEDWAVFLGRLTPVVRSFVSIPAGVFEVPFVRYTLLTLLGLGDLVLRLRRRRLRARVEAGRTSTTRSATSTTSSRRRSSCGVGVARLEVRQAAPAARSPRSLPAPDELRNVTCRSYTRPRDRADPTRRREGAVRAAHPRARGALLGRARVRPLHLRARGRGVRAARPPRSSACRTRSASRTAPTRSSSRSRRSGSGAATR